MDAFGPGDPAALQRIIEYFQAGRAIAWDRPSHDLRVSRLRKAVQDRLGGHRSAETTESLLAADDARWLIARAEGFERWEELVAGVDA